MTIIDPLFDPDVVEDPHGYYAQLRTTDPVHELPGTGTFLVTRMDLIHEVVANPAVFSSRSGRFLHHRAVGGQPGLRGRASRHGHRPRPRRYGVGHGRSA